jgi:hypothetical protein
MVIAPETADTAIILKRFCVTADSVEDAQTGGGLAVDLLRFAFWGVVFTAIAFSGDGGSGRIAA